MNPADSLYTDRQNDNSMHYTDTLIKFDLSNLPANTQVQSATFELWVWNSGSIVNVYQLLTAWEEDTILYCSPIWGGAPVCSSNSPTDLAAAGPQAGIDFKTVPVGTFRPHKILPTDPFPSWSSGDFTAVVQAWLSGESNDGVMLRQDNPSGLNVNGAQYHSSEWYQH